MNTACFLFGFRNIRKDEIEGKRILEVGACDVNGSLRPLIESYCPAEYVGADIAEGPGVDVICDAAQLVRRFGEGSFDAVICTEMIEHVRDWRAAVHNLKAVCKKGGVLLVTTRSPGFLYHGWPYDFWRYELQDIERIFGDFRIERLEPDPRNGVLLKCVKPADFSEKEPGAEFALYSIVTRSRTADITDRQLCSPVFRSRIFVQRLKEFLIKHIASIPV